MISVLGTGAWGTTFAAVLGDAGNDVLMWGRNANVVAEINARHTNAAYVPARPLPASVRATTDLTEALRAVEYVVVALPSQIARAALAGAADVLSDEVRVVSLMKGIELQTDLRMTQMLGDVLSVPSERLLVLSGPNLSVEIAQKQPTASVIACADIARAEEFAQRCATAYFRPYVNDDVVGVELAGAIKNVIAVAVGMAAGSGFGDNTTATIITRGLAEITRLAVALGADPATLAGLAGMGDLVATCSSELSRNHRLGLAIGRGMSLGEAVAATGGTAEGAKSCRSVAHLAARTGVEMPITNAVVAVLYESLGVRDMTAALLSRPRKDERG